MASYRNLIAIDLASYGSAFLLINQFCDDDEIKVFEISPIGQAGLLIFLIKDPIAAEVLKNEIESLFKCHILSICLLKNFDQNLLPIYLSQNKTPILKSILIQEFSFVSKALEAAAQILEQKLQLVDFRIVRTYPLNAVIVSTAVEDKLLFDISVLASAKSSVVIENVSPVLKTYFEIT